VTKRNPTTCHEDTQLQSKQKATKQNKQHQATHAQTTYSNKQHKQ
jgi:hypothetical protein